MAERRDESRTIAQTLDRARTILRELPRAELTRILDDVLTKYLGS